jgi:hypothetical protein
MASPSPSELEERAPDGKKKTESKNEPSTQGVMKMRVFVAPGSDMAPAMPDFDKKYMLLNAGIAHEVRVGRGGEGMQRGVKVRRQRGDPEDRCHDRVCRVVMGLWDWSFAEEKERD